MDPCTRDLGDMFFLLLFFGFLMHYLLVQWTPVCVCKAHILRFLFFVNIHLFSCCPSDFWKFNLIMLLPCLKFFPNYSLPTVMFSRIWFINQTGAFLRIRRVIKNTKIIWFLKYLLIDQWTNFILLLDI